MTQDTWLAQFHMMQAQSSRHWQPIWKVWYIQGASYVSTVHNHQNLAILSDLCEFNEQNHSHILLNEYYKFCSCEQAKSLNGSNGLGI